MARLLILFASLLAISMAWLAEARADHALEFYPSYYPHEIRIEAVDPAAAAERFATNAIHAYVGGDPFAGRAIPANLGRVESLGSYLVLAFNTAAGAWRNRDARCAAGATWAGALAASRGNYIFHPYPVTPFHADYLQHFDLVEAARKRYGSQSGQGASASTPRVRAKGSLADGLVPAAWRGAGQGWDATVEEIPLPDLVGSSRLVPGEWLGPPWVKEGWFHAYLLLAEAVTDGTAKREVEAIYRRLTTGTAGGDVERLNQERRLVTLLLRGCERFVLGYTLRREYFNESDYSEGIENIAYDSQVGLGSPVFIRTVKLKDFPWNGWLRLGTEGRPRAAWNPLGGFTDGMGRLLWAAVGDPAGFPAPYGAGWVTNRVRPTVTVAGSPSGSLDVPRDALLPEPGTGLLRPVGDGATARARIVYRVLASSFHDKTAMGAADILYPFSVAYRWGVRRPGGGAEHDPVVDASTALVRSWLAGVRVVREEREVKEFDEVKLTFRIFLVEVYLKHTPADSRQAAAVAPPWSTLSWPLLALMEEAVRQGVAAFSAGEAERRGLPWLDLVRDQAVKDRLARLAEEFGRQGYVPAALKGLVTAAEATNRWDALRQFYATHRHFLVTNGPYRLQEWSRDSVVLQAFRDPSYPVGLGLFNRYPIPRRAYVSRIARLGDRVEVQADVEKVFKHQRSYTIVREALHGPGSQSEADAADRPTCRYVVVGPDGGVQNAGTTRPDGAGVFGIDLRGPRGPGPHALLVALYLGENFMNPDVKMIPLPGKDRS